MENVLFQSIYFSYWYENVDLTSKGHVITELRKFERFLILKGFKGELDFDHFHGSYGHPGRYRPIRESFIDEFIDYLRDDHKATKTVLYSAISSLKNFFRFLYEMEMIKNNPMVDYPNPYYSRPIKNTALSKEECINLLNVAIKKDPFFRQDFILIWFMLITGVRNSEARLLSTKNINLNTRMVLLDKGQKGQVRSTSITEALAEELNRYMGNPNFDSWKNEGNTNLFFQGNAHLSAAQLRKKVKELCIEAGISHHVTPQDLRRTAGYLMQTSGMHIVEIQRQLGHKILATTLRYIPPLAEMAEILLKAEI